MCPKAGVCDVRLSHVSGGDRITPELAAWMQWGGFTCSDTRPQAGGGGRRGSGYHMGPDQGCIRTTDNAGEWGVTPPPPDPPPCAQIS